MEEKKMQEEELALEALEEISGGVSKDDVKKSLIKAKNYIRTNPKKSFALGWLLMHVLAGSMSGFPGEKILLTTLNSLKERIFSE